jgi:hypothetical protein
MRFPKEFFGKKHWLGSMVDAVENAAAPSPLCCMRDRLQDLKELLAYSRKFHHENGNATGAAPADNELRNYVKRAIKLCSS